MADVIYQGRNLTPTLKTDGGQAMGRLSDAIMKAEETKYNAFKQNEKEFLANSKIDPVLLINDSNQKAQTKALADFNNKWAQEYKKYQGNLPTEVKQQMQSEKSVIIGQQQKMQSDMARALQDRAILEKDIAGNIDRADADKRWNHYISTGTYDTTPLKPSAIDPDIYFSNKANKGTGTKDVVSITINKDGKKITEKRTSSASEPEARAMVEADMISKPRLAMGYIKKFQALKTTDPETYIKYLDTSGDGQVDASEEQAINSASNPIIRWAQDNYWQKRIDIGESDITTPITAPKAGVFNWNIGVTAGNNQNNKFNVQNNFPQATTEGKFIFPDYQNLGQVSQTSETQNIPEIIVKDESGNETTKPLNQTAAFHLVGFSPTKDQIIIELDGTSSDSDYRKGDVLVVPASRFDDLLKKKPFGIYRNMTTAKPMGKVNIGL